MIVSQRTMDEITVSSDEFLAETYRQFLYAFYDGRMMEVENGDNPVRDQLYVQRGDEEHDQA
jgi:hypothetical protein